MSRRTSCARPWAAATRTTRRVETCFMIFILTREVGLKRRRSQLLGGVPDPGGSTMHDDLAAQTSALLFQVEQHDARRVAHEGVVAGEGEPAGLAVHMEDSDVVAPLVAAVQER